MVEKKCNLEVKGLCRTNCWRYKDKRCCKGCGEINVCGNTCGFMKRGKGNR